VAFGRFLGVGVRESGDSVPVLEHAVPDITALIDVLGEAFAPEILSNPDEETIRRHLRALPESMSDGPLVVLWSGHAFGSAADSLRLLARDSAARPSAGIGISDVVAACAESGANQLLFLVDTCFSGAAVAAGDVAAQILRSRPPEGRYVWVGVLASCLDVETAQDGLFGQRLRELLAHGPRTPELRVRWSPHSRYVRGDDVCDAVLKEWDSDVQTPDFSSRGSAWWVFPNPLFDEGAPDQVVEHLLQAARGGAGLLERSWFTGRTTEVDQAVGWVRSARPGIYVITGSAGTGKSAIAGRVVSLSNPAERGRLLADGSRWEHQDPGERSVQAHVHARGLTADRAAAVIGDQLVTAGVLPAQAEPRNASELVGQVQRAVGQGTAPPVLVIDGLDEARGEAFGVAEDLLARLAPYAVIVVATRELRRGDDEPSLIDVLAPGGAGLDLDDPAAQDRTRGDLAAYITARLAERDPRMDGQAVAGYLAGEASMTADRPFLLARLVTDQLRTSPVDTTREGWEAQVSRSIEDAFDADLDAVAPAPSRPNSPQRDAAGRARSLLAALTWGYGAGFPEEEWLAAANALTPGAGFGREDVLWLLGKLGRYILQDGEAGVAVYRLAHQSLAEHLRPPFRPSHDQVFDPQALAVAKSLADRYDELLAGEIPVTDPAYLWRYLWRHAADSGPAGLAILRDLAALDGALQPDVALAALHVATHLAYWGQRQDAVAPAEEAVHLYRALSEDNSAFHPNLAGALNDLGIRYSGVGRRQDAVGPAGEAVRLYRALAEDNPAFLPDLAMALNNLGARYRGVGRGQDAIAPTEEAVQLRREQAEDNPAFLPDLAMALNNLGNGYSAVGRRQDAIAPTEEAVQLRREQAEDNPAFLPDLAMALNNLGARYSGVGRRQDAIGPVEEAVRLYRALAADNPAFRPDLAGALNNLGACYGGVGRRQDAVAPVEEAVRLYRALAADNPAFLSDVASALNNLGTCYGGVGRRQDAVAPAEEAVQLRREQARDNPAFVPDLAAALNNLGIRYGQVGRQDAGAPVEEAVHLYRTLAEDNPAFLSDLATALINLSASYKEVGRRQDALASAEESVQLYRALAEDNPAFVPDLAMALNNLGIRYGEVGGRDLVAPAEEAVHLYRVLAQDIPAYRPDLAAALNNLGICYGEVGRRQDALASAEESVQLYRDLAADNPAFLPDLAAALNNLGIRYGEAGRQDAVAPAEEAVRLYRVLAEDASAYRPDLASALSNLGTCYSKVDRRQDALASAEESVYLYRVLAADNPAFLLDLAAALNSLGNRYNEAGSPERGEAAWQEALSDVSLASAAFLLTSRAAAAEAGHPGAAEWLAQALQHASDDREGTAAIHEQARHHRPQDPTVFDGAWTQKTGQPPPGWLTIDAGLLQVAQEWIASQTYAEEHDFLASHSELLDPAADDAVSEALLSVSEGAAQQFSNMRQAARAEGVEAAYCPLLLAILARDFTDADPEAQRALLAARRDDLLSAPVRDIITSLAEEDDATAVHRAVALLDLAALGEHEPVLDALMDPARFPALLQELASRPDPAALGPAIEAALTTAMTLEQTATALFYSAVSAARANDPDRAAQTLAQARRVDPGQATAWIGVLAEIGQHHPEVLPLITALTRPPADPEEPPPAAPAADTGENGNALH
jgi:hypothetical protein